MPAKYPGYSLERDGVTQGLLDRFQYCRQACRYFIDGWEPVGNGGVNVSLWFGTVWHRIMECVHQDAKGKILTFPLKPAGPMMTMLENVAFSVVDAALDEDLPQCFDAENTEEVEEAGQILKMMFPVFMRRYWKTDFACTWVGLEEKFSTPFAGFLLRGMRDGMCAKKPKMPGSRLVEYKTKSRIDADGLQATVLFDQQVHTYGLTSEIDHPGAIIGEVTYHLIRRPGERKGKKETDAEFIERLRKRIVSDPEHYFMRFNIPLTKKHKLRFRAELINRLGEFKAWLEGERPTYRSTGSCVGRNYTCPFVNVCGSEDPDKELEKTCVKREEVFPELDS